MGAEAEKEVILLTKNEVKKLNQTALNARRLLVEMLAAAGGGHIGGTLSIIDILTVLYHQVMRLKEGDPDWPERDRFVLSKGHAGPALYTILHTKGYLSREDLMTLNRPGTMLPSHCDITRTPGVDMFGGSLGQGLSAAVGMALAARMDSRDLRVFCIIGDGESDEGQIWEAGMAAAKYKLGNLIGIVDYNKLQIDGPVEAVMPLEPLRDKWAAFGWDVKEIDGHDVEQIHDALVRCLKKPDQPHMIIAHTIKGKGVSFCENTMESHNMGLTPTQLAQALSDLEGSEK